MKRGAIIGLIVGLALVVTFGVFWFNTQPVWPVDKIVEKEVLDNLPVRNKKIVEFMEVKGADLAPTYKTAVCTEFVIKVIDNFVPLTKTEKNDIRVITNAELDSLIETESSVIKGVQNALVKSGKGIEITESINVLPGDFVQFWNTFQGRGYGHCGIVLDIDPNKTITLYSSHPFTGGYGKQQYLWPEKIYFVRLK
ncbi:MAG TPA: hypothetical protein VIU12_12710 [Chryseolinea sp.]